MFIVVQVTIKCSGCTIHYKVFSTVEQGTTKCSVLYNKSP